MENSTKLPADVVANLRMLAHDLSNSLETILQIGSTKSILLAIGLQLETLVTGTRSKLRFALLGG